MYPAVLPISGFRCVAHLYACTYFSRHCHPYDQSQKLFSVYNKINTYRRSDTFPLLQHFFMS